MAGAARCGAGARGDKVRRSAAAAAATAREAGPASRVSGARAGADGRAGTGGRRGCEEKGSREGEKVRAPPGKGEGR